MRQGEARGWVEDTISGDPARSLKTTQTKNLLRSQRRGWTPLSAVGSGPTPALFSPLPLAVLSEVYVDVYGWGRPRDREPPANSCGAIGIARLLVG